MENSAQSVSDDLLLAIPPPSMFVWICTYVGRAKEYIMSGAWSFVYIILHTSISPRIKNKGGWVSTVKLFMHGHIHCCAV